jgi:hypothetical protein
MHDTQLPALHTLLLPQDVPSGALPPALHTGVPDEQVSVPVLHSCEGVQLPPALHVMQLPPLHTLLAPQDVPFGRVPETTQTALPEEHSMKPVLHEPEGGVQLVP